MRKNVVLYIAHGRVAQLGECCIRIAEVEGSTPFASTKNNAHHFAARYFLYMMPKGVEPGRVTAQRKRFGEPFLAVSGETGTEMQSISVGEPC